ncbi:MAG: T9SS C-terminal target domain-containing protein, partial [Calditrichaeota bacterium]
PIHNINKPPRIHDNLNYIEASVNQAFQLDFQITDPENDAVAFEIENIPDNATLAGYTLCWTPAWEQADSTFILRAKATDTHNNSYTAIFTIYVNIVQDGLLHSLTNWQISGDGSAYISSYEQPFKSHNTVIQTQNNWGAIQQQIVVDPYRLYRIELWIAKQINLNSNHTFLQIEEPGRRFLFDDFIDSDTYYDENGLLHTYCAIPFRTGNHEQIILSLHSGDEQKSTSGKLYLTGLRLVDEGPSREILFTKVLTGPLVEDGGYSNCAAFGDFDHDSYPDLFISNHAGNNFLYKNNRDGTFSKIINNIIVQDNAAADGGVWGDFNRDGYADLFVSNWGDAKNVLYRNNYDGSFSKINDSVFEKDQGTSHKGAWTDFNNDGFLDLFVPVSGGYNMLYAGDGYGGFKRITDGAVVNEWSVSTGACWGDYNGDFYLDVFVANGYGENNYLYKNNGDGTFTKVTSGSIVNDGGKSRGGCWGDYDNDGRIDLFVFNYGDEDNFLYHNNGNGTFTKTTTGDIVNDGGDSQDARWGDIDMDGDIDLFVANYDGQNNFLYSNNGDGTFTKITDDITVNEGGTSAGCDWADCDWDGDLDLVVANTGGENNFYYLNNNAANNNWFRIRIQGHRGITAKIGIKAHISDVAVWWWRDISGQTIAGVTSNGLAVTFGVGHAGIIDSLMIKWPSGGIQVKEHIDINKELVIREPTYQTITFCERAASDYHDVTFDSHIREKHYAQKRNYGATDNIRVLGTNTSAGEWRGLLKFDFRPGLIAEGVTDASQIMRADISLRLSESEGSELNMMNLYKIIQDWGEGKKNNEYAMYGDVTWKSAKHGIANWTQAGAKSTIYDHVAIPVATTIIGNDVGHYYHFDVTSSVREMFTDQQNYGWLMVLEKEAGMRYFCSKEATDPWYRPFLIIYCTPAAPSTNNLLFADNSNANFSDVTSDAHIREINFAQNKNYGATDNIRILGSNPAAKEWKGLLKFDFIPALSAAFNDADAIVSAKIRLYLSESEGTKNDNLFFYRLLQDWSEGTHNNDPASSGEVTWLSAHHWQQTWQTPGGYCSPIPAVQQSVGNTIESWYEFDVTKSVQTMFSSNQNYGWLLRLEANAGMRYFRSRECANPAHRPQLIVSISGQQQKSVAHKNISTTVPDAFALFQNYPNPFNPTTAIEFALPEPTFVTLKIYNALGAEITTLVSQRLGAGIHSYVWNASEFGSGTYLCRLQAGKFLQTKKLVFLH